MADTSGSDDKQRDGASLSPKLHERGLPIGKVDAAIARRYKHAAGKSSTYSPEVVDMIYHMAREGPMSDESIGGFVAAKLAAEREFPRPEPAPTWDQLVFLSANLTRLVIDPYREKCSSQVQLGPDRPRPLTLESPIVFGGINFAGLPEQHLAVMSAAAATATLAVTVEAGASTTGSTLADHTSANRILSFDLEQSLAGLSDAAAVEITARSASDLTKQKLAPIISAIQRETGAQIPIGVVAPAFNARHVVDETAELDVDFYVTDAQWTTDLRPEMMALPELLSSPAIHVLADTVDRLRHHCREERTQVIYRGGIRCGADAGKAICLGASAVTLGLAAIAGMGFKLVTIKDEASLLTMLDQPLDTADAAQRVVNVAKSVAMEVTMLARACGKSNVANMEPEDLRSLSIEVSRVTGVPLAGKDYDFRVRT